jgi:hypothetical protein
LQVCDDGGSRRRSVWLAALSREGEPSRPTMLVFATPSPSTLPTSLPPTVPLPTPTPAVAFKAPLPTVDDDGEVGGKSF